MQPSEGIFRLEARKDKKIQALTAGTDVSSSVEKEYYFGTQNVGASGVSEHISSFCVCFLRG